MYEIFRWSAQNVPYGLESYSNKLKNIKAAPTGNETAFHLVSSIKINVAALLGIYGDKSAGVVRKDDLLSAVWLVIAPVLGKTRIRIMVKRLPLSDGQPEMRDYGQLN